jgi:hypothetical protein
MPGNDPARGARDTGRTDRGVGERGNEGGRGGRDTSGAQGGGLGRSRGGLVGNSETAQRNRERTGLKDPSRKEKPGDAFGKWARRVAGMMIPGIPGMVVGGGMLVGDMMGDQVQMDQEDVDAGRKISNRMDDPGAQGMGRVDNIKGQGIGSFGNAASDDRGTNSNGLGKGMTGGGGGQREINTTLEEQKRRRLAAQQTALGAPLDRLGPGVKPI